MRRMQFSHRNPALEVPLGDGTLERIAATLSDLYFMLYEERPVDPRASLTGNMLAFVFEGGLTVADEWLLRNGREDQLQDFRQHFFAVAGDELVEVVGSLTGVPVTYAFYGFGPKTRSTHAIFVLDMSEPHGGEQRQAVLNWSQQVRRNARRLREQHQATSEAHRALREQVRAQREAAVRRESDEGGGPRNRERSD